MSKRLEAIERMARGETPQAPVARLIGFELTSIRHGESVIELQAGDMHANPMGTLQAEFCAISQMPRWGSPLHRLSKRANRLQPWN